MLFSSADKCKIQLLKLVCPVVSSLAWYYTQDALLSLAIHFGFNLILIPFLINKMLNKDIYDVLGFKTMIPETKSSQKTTVTIVLLVVTLLFNILGVYFGKIPKFSQMVNLGPYFSYKFLSYIYYLLVAGLMVLVINVEMKFYFGVLSIIEPDSILGYLSMGFFMACHWIGFGFAFLNDSTDYVCLVLLVILVLFYMGLYHVKETSSYKDARWVYLVVFGANYALLFLYGVLYNYKKVSGVSVVVHNNKNIWNRII